MGLFSHRATDSDAFGAGYPDSDPSCEQTWNMLSFRFIVDKEKVLSPTQFPIQ